MSSDTCNNHYEKGEKEKVNITANMTPAGSATASTLQEKTQ